MNHHDSTANDLLIARYRAALADAEKYMPTGYFSALKQAANDHGIPFGEPMKAFIDWAQAQKAAEPPDIVFSIREGEWRARVGGVVLPAIWNSRGAAVAGMQTESRRRAGMVAK